jgi:hypothetical protein
MLLLFLKRRQKFCLYPLIKKKRIAQLINGKPGENRYSKTTRGLLQDVQLTIRLGRPTNSPNILQPQTPDVLIITSQRKTPDILMPSHAELSISGCEKISATGSVSRGEAHTATNLKPDRCCNLLALVTWEILWGKATAQTKQ